tara:strand:- start:198 stop:1361 length:1164 start_codon:yes stop_codon:yes gene_type:complete
MRTYRKFIIEKFEFILGILVIFAFCILIILSQFYNLDNFSTKNNNLIKNEIYEEITFKDLNNTLHVLQTGIFIDKIYNLDKRNKTFSANGWIWIKWKGDKNISGWNEESRKSPIKTLVFYNGIDLNDFYKGKTSQSKIYVTDGWNYQSRPFSGKFTWDRVDYRKFPFEDIDLPIEISTSDHWLTEVILSGKKERKNSKVAPDFGLPGYKFKSFEVKDMKRIFLTSYGLDEEASLDFNNPNKSEYSFLISNMSFSRSFSSSIWNLFVPLITVLLVAIFSLLIDPRNNEPKIALPASVLLVLVFLQEGYKNLLPDSISYLTFMDYLYAWSYFLTLLVFIDALYSTNKILRTRNEVRYKAALKSIKRGRKIALIILIITPLYAFICWCLS